jgi:uncharacterized repeat protein (TIGR01451 family)
MWSENFGAVGLDTTNVAITAVAVSGSKVYVGGHFTSFGYQDPVTYNNIAMWDGHGWHPLGAGVTGGIAQVYAIALLGSDVYVGGLFSTAGSTPASSIAKWNPTTGWSALAGGINDGAGCCSPTVYALAVSGTTASPTVYAGGIFTDADTQLANNIAMWNGTSWSPLGAGLTGGSGRVNVLLLRGGTLYAAGNFTQSGSGTSATKFNSIASWNGSAWSAVGGAGISTSFGYEGSVNALSVNPTTGVIYAGGSFAEAGGTLGSGGTATGATPATNVAAFDGTSWSALGSGLSQQVDGLTFWNGKLFASYSQSFVPVISQWNGSSWSPLSQPLGGSGGSGPVMVTASGGVEAAGQFGTGGSTVLDSLGLWNGTTWKGYGLGVPAEITALAASNHDLYATGGITVAGSTAATSIAHFNGTTWTSMGSTGITGTSGTCPQAGVTFNICSVAIDPATHHVFIAGNFSAIDGVPASNIAMWNGSSWQALGTGIDGSVIALLVYNGKLYAGGTFQHAGGVAADDVAQWDLTSGGWAPVGDDAVYTENVGADGAVNALAGVTATGSKHYVLIGGGFLAVGDGTTATSVGGLVMFDTTAGPYSSPLAGYYYFPANGTAGVSGTIYALYADGTNFYLGGSFTGAGGQSTSNFAMVNLSGAWSYPGSVTGGPVYVITKAASNIFVAGSFTAAGGVAANNIAQYTPGAATPWAALGSGVTSSSPGVFALAQSADGLYAGGDLSTAGAATPSAGIALWTATKFPITVTEAASPTTTTVGSPATFTATVSNTGKTSASGVTLTSSVPANASFGSATPSQGSCSLTAGTIKCPLGNIAASGSATVSIVLTPTATGTLKDTVKVSETGVSYTNSATAKVTVN